MSKIQEIEEKIEATKQKLLQLKALQKKVEAQKKEAESRARRAAETRRKILAGAFILEQMERDPALDSDIKKRLGRWLLRNDDRRLFDLPPLQEIKTVASEIATV